MSDVKQKRKPNIKVVSKKENKDLKIKKAAQDLDLETQVEVSFDEANDALGVNLIDSFFKKEASPDRAAKKIPSTKKKKATEGNLRCGFVSVIGLPNAGKSTLVNRIIGEQVSIVSPKAQTTRQSVTGIFSNETSQIIFVDAPGFIQAETGLNHFIQRQWEEAIKGSDVVMGVLNVDCDTEEKISNAILTLASVDKPKFAFINKVDIVKYAERLFIIEQKLRDHNIPYMFGSAKTATKETIDSLIEQVSERLPLVKEFMYDKSLYTLQTEKEIAAEVIREKCFSLLGQEVPYQIGVHIISFQEDPKCVKIYADIWISKERYKKIVVGQKGAKIQQIGTEARKDIERMLGVQVYLSLKVKLKDSWTKNPNMLKELGYEFRK